MNKNRKKPFIFFWLIAMVILITLNIFVYPSMLKNSTSEVSYNEFLNQLKNKNINRVEVDVEKIYFSLKSDSADIDGTSLLEKINPAREKVYITVRMEDEQLVERLYESGAAFSKIAPKKLNPILSFVISYILPVVIFALIWTFVLKQMSRGGNMMSFGKSNGS